MAQYAPVLDLSSLTSSQGFRILGLNSGDNLGQAISAGRDIDGDGLDDLVLGANGVDANGTNNGGAAYVVFGARHFGASLDLATLNGTNGFVIEGITDLHGIADAIAPGDIDGDGKADIILGGKSTNAQEGSAYLVYGQASAYPASLDVSSADYRLDGVDASDMVGAHVGGGGDLNGDGREDMVASAEGLGEVYVRFGAASQLSGSEAVTALDGATGFTINGLSVGDVLGSSATLAGDVNGDGISDLILGANGHAPGGSVYVMFGRTGAYAASFDITTLDGNTGFRLDGASGDNLGTLVSVGDLNGDGFDDLVMGCPSADGAAADFGGTAYVVFGKASGFAASMALSALDGTNGFRMRGGVDFDFLGQGIGAIGDYNGDGFGDFIVGAPGDDAGGANAGAAYVVFGRAGGWTSELDLSTLDGDDGFRIDGADGGDSLGRTAVGLGDINRDGLADIAVASPFDGPGVVTVIYGALPGEAVTRVGTDIAQAIRGSAFADSLDGRGGRDQIYGYGGNDTLIGGDGKDVLEGGAGSDFASYADASAAVTVSLLVSGVQQTGGAGQDSLRLVENLIGSAFRDALTGDGGNNRLDGGGGEDTLVGGLGDDVLTGGGKVDRLIGGGGADQLSGSGGGDLFVFSAISDSTNGARDQILDLGAGDIIDLGAIDANLGAGGDQAFVMVAAFTGSAGQARLNYSAGSDRTFLQLDQDGDGAADFVLVLKGDHRAFTDFVL